ncbi:MAG: MCE family protein [Actinomycetota bacterium]|nr:MCE family protein [Actinomycetota bacterium]
MITPTVRLQLVAFVVITVLGVGYVGTRYADAGRLFGATTYPVLVQLADSGGIFTGADVTYRGVSVGRVGPLRLTEEGVEAQLDIRKDAQAIPAQAIRAQVHNLSAIGEQYVDLLPTTSQGPFLAAGAVIPSSRTSTPVPVEDLVRNLDQLVRSVPLESLATVVDELGTAFEGTGADLQTLLDTSELFTRDAVDALPQTLALIRQGRTVLETQNEQDSAIRSFSEDLALLAEQLQASDPDIRRLIGTGTGFSTQTSALLAESGDQLGSVVADLLTVARVAEPRQDGLRQLLVTYPAVVATTYTTVPGDGTVHLGLVLNNFDPFACTRGYGGTRQRPGTATENVPANLDARCIPTAQAPTVRGAHNAPREEQPGAPAVADRSGDAPGASVVVRPFTGMASVLEG